MTRSRPSRRRRRRTRCHRIRGTWASERTTSLGDERTLAEEGPRADGLSRARAASSGASRAHRLLDVLPRRLTLRGRRLAPRGDGLPLAARPAARRGGPEPGRRLRDVVLLGYLDAVAFRRGEDLPPGALLRRRGRERGLVEASHRVAHVALVVERQVALAVLVDVGEHVLVHRLALLFPEIWHIEPPRSTPAKRVPARVEIPLDERGKLPSPRFGAPWRRGSGGRPAARVRLRVRRAATSPHR